MPNGKPTYTLDYRHSQHQSIPYSTQEQRERARRESEYDRLLKASELAWVTRYNYGNRAPDAPKPNMEDYYFNVEKAKEIAASKGVEHRSMADAFFLRTPDTTHMGVWPPMHVTNYPTEGKHEWDEPTPPELSAVGTRAFPYTRSMFSDDAKGMSEWMKLTLGQRAFGYEPDHWEANSPAGQAKYSAYHAAENARIQAERDDKRRVEEGWKALGKQMGERNKQQDFENRMRAFQESQAAQRQREAARLRGLQPLPGHFNMQDKYYGRNTINP